jgi:hypothetical protein
VPAEWLAMEMRLMCKWERSRGTVSKKTGMRWWIGTGVEPPKPGLWNS